MKRSKINNAKTQHKKPKYQKLILNDDISNGKAARKIALTALGKDEEMALEKYSEFIYVRSSILNGPDKSTLQLNDYLICDCKNCDQNSLNCTCHQLNQQICNSSMASSNEIFTSKKLNFNTLNLSQNSPLVTSEISNPNLYFCSDICNCNYKTCHLKLEKFEKSFKEFYDFEVFYFNQGLGHQDSSKNFGLINSGQKILKGSFIGEYTGEIISDQEAELRNDDSYFFKYTNGPSSNGSADSNGSNQLNLDAKYFSNYTRFINHSCNSNLLTFCVFNGHANEFFSRIFFVARFDIGFGEELTFDYGDTFWLAKNENGVYCECGNGMCRYGRPPEDRKDTRENVT